MEILPALKVNMRKFYWKINSIKLVNLNQRTFHDFNVYYDSKKGGVDFIVHKLFDNAVPIEIGIGKKSKKQVKNAIDSYNCNHSILISNKTD